ncbi:hypothetical protein CONCODRAFT_2023 [Conidiobolus coronatus NRRL 28638]|uniref:G-protein coupled receptors family 1 profile domain-containing protein n=1 Tax=Conidiobolus coronatus (strain ATCC 28846 / CBS 209.66 / NRRL 28638) TaxID=796925 RepID=A0A137PIW5_CONC2|nr:hypothetical protein CONCODRAFT_2023 [Conidiobolus coronatus NRRL 28638]|eukprot:KXN74948.1 hypothetical protein CONCODRAFT_2023 [Conidiobolus coronatus NRRL 28638]
MKVMLILNAAEFELGIAKILLSIYEFVLGKNALDKDTFMCRLNALENQMFIRLELTIAAVLSLMRYLTVCHSTEKSFKFWLVITILACAPTSFVYIYPAILNDATPSSSRIACYPYMNPGDLSKIASCILPFLILIPCWVITFCYFSIGYKVNKKLNQMKKDSKNINDVQGLAAIKRQKIKIIVQLVTVIVIYNLNFSVSYITFILKFAIGYVRPPIIEAIAVSLTFITFTVNPILTITFQPELNQEFTSILFFFKLKIKKFFSSISSRGISFCRYCAGR